MESAEKFPSALGQWWAITTNEGWTLVSSGLVARLQSHRRAVVCPVRAASRPDPCHGRHETRSVRDGELSCGPTVQKTNWAAAYYEEIPVKSNCQLEALNVWQCSQGGLRRRFQ
jgi:hypothetical protein